ncbi:MAG: hypothetical protein ACREF8_06885, partial [Chthoniobacterales bacterium]
TYLTQHALEARGLGFVILHRCGSDFYFLIVSTWRGNNEVWEAVFYKDGAPMADFALFPARGNSQANLLRLGTRSGLARKSSVGTLSKVSA